MKRSKISFEELKLESFVTSLHSNHLKGGSETDFTMGANGCEWSTPAPCNFPDPTGYDSETNAIDTNLCHSTGGGGGNTGGGGGGSVTGLPTCGDGGGSSGDFQIDCGPTGAC